MDSEANLQQLFSKYLQRRCTPEEVEELITLLQRADAEESLNGPMLALWEQLKDDKTQYPVDWDKMYGVLRRTEEDLLSLHQRRARPFHRRLPLFRNGWHRVAAVLVLLMMVSAAYWALTGNNRKHPHQPVGAKGVDGILSALNKKQIIHLPDGSTVILNADSKLDYPASFAGKYREVYLSGEGYFDIVHHARMPFLVHTGKLTTRVLGTAFNIKAYPGDEAIEVTVTHGKVQVEKENKNMGMLTADQQISFSKRTEEVVQQKVDTKLVTAWKPEEIRLDDITMEEAAARIEKQYKVLIEFANPAIKACRVTATFYEDDLLNEILTVVCGVSQSTFTVHDNTIVIDGKGCL
ncbi:MAG TPA: FecR domain-containing protein [Puia sp.]|jgi:ferric-dicitrate binding protein FerR (iron transport regulator)|nr:FecR domain-containing protein [Puia sp.]